MNKIGPRHCGSELDVRERCAVQSNWILQFVQQAHLDRLLMEIGNFLVQTAQFSQSVKGDQGLKGGGLSLDQTMVQSICSVNTLLDLTNCKLRQHVTHRRVKRSRSSSHDI